MDRIGEYQVVEKIAEGGMGSVYKARDPQTDALVAIKVLPAHLAKNEILRKRFEQEYDAARALSHANIVRALDFGFHCECPFLVMEFVEGESLGDKLEREGRIPETEAIKLIAQVAQGLHKAHKQGLVHRDVKPDNILVTVDGQAKLTDMGLVKAMETDLNLTRTGRGLGTPHFMAPEQFRDAKNADQRCDVYSLGATLYMMVTGELPFKLLGPVDAWMKKLENKLTPPRELMPELSERVDWAIRRAMHSDKQQRPATCREFVEDLTGRSTRRLRGVPEGVDQDMWRVRYRDKNDVTHTIKGSTGTIRRSLKEGEFGEASNIRAARESDPHYEPLRVHPEFRDLVLAGVIHAPSLSCPREAKKTNPNQTPSPIIPIEAAASPPAAATKPKAAKRSSKLPSSVDKNLNPLGAQVVPAPEATEDWGRLLLLALLAILAGITGSAAITMFFQ